VTEEQGAVPDGPQEQRTTLEVDRGAHDARGLDVSRCRILVTNDDGIDSPGLRLLASSLAASAQVVVAAPADDVSGAGTSIGRYDLDDPTRLREVHDLDGVEAYAVDGPPGLAVMAAALGAFGRVPDVVVSGPNAGINTGTSIVHSGTVGAAITARTFGIDGIAVSLAEGDRWHWDSAVAVARAAVRWVLARAEPTTLNVNVPGRPVDRIAGARWAEIDEFGHFHVAAADTEGGVLDLEVRDRTSGSDPRTDTAICLGGEVSLTLLSPLGRVPAVDDPPRRSSASVRGEVH
jgi:5'-nucleotidase